MLFRSGLALSALVASGLADSGGTYHAKAARVAKLLGEELWDGAHLSRAQVNGRPIGVATLRDYAYAAAGLYAWSKVSADAQAAATAAEMVKVAWHEFHGPGGWQLSADRLVDLGPSVLAMTDRALPAPTATLMRLTLALEPPLADEQLRQRAAQSAARFPAEVDANPFGYASHVVNAHDLLVK